MNDQEPFDKRARARELADEYAKRGDTLGWFDALYKESGGDNEKIPWADLEPNRFFKSYAEDTNLRGDGRKALVVGCGLGDDAVYLDELGFKVTAFDISKTAIDWAKRLHNDKGIQFEVVDLFESPRKWLGAFEFVLEIYTIQPLPIEMRSSVIDAVAAFVANGGKLLVVTRGREDHEVPDQMPWPLSRRDLSRFEENGLTQTDFFIMPPYEPDDETPRFVIEYDRLAEARTQ